MGPYGQKGLSLFLRPEKNSRILFEYTSILALLLPTIYPNFKKSNLGKKLANTRNAQMLLERLQPLLTRQRRPQQSGFTRSRSTIDAILTLRLLAELHREFRKPLHVAYLDIKAAFDSVDRQALWKALHATGALQFLIQLIQDLHTNTMSRVRVGKRLLKAFYTSSGVRQGCVLHHHHHHRQP